MVMAGTVVGVILAIGMVFGFFAIMDKLETTKITCLPQKEVTRGEINCKILEIKERGDVLKVSEMISPPTDERELQKIRDKTTAGKFVEVKFEIRNLGKEVQDLGEIVLIDNQNRKFSQLWSLDIEYWLPEDRFSSILPGLAREFTKIFEVPKDSSDFKLKAKIWRFIGID